MKAKKYFDKMYIRVPERNNIWASLSKYIQKDIGHPKTILELGAGYGDFINNIEAKNKIALDIDASSKKYAKKNVKFFVGKCTNLKFLKNKTVDVVFASNLFEHLSHDELEMTIKELRRVIQDDGKLVLLQPNFYYAYKEYFHDYTHKTIFTHIGLSDFLSTHGFKPIKIKPKFLPFSMQSKYSGKSIPKFLYIKPLINLYLNSPIKPFASQMYIVCQKI